MAVRQYGHQQSRYEEKMGPNSPRQLAKITQIVRQEGHRYEGDNGIYRQENKCLNRKRKYKKGEKEKNK